MKAKAKAKAKGKAKARAEVPTSNLAIGVTVEENSKPSTVMEKLSPEESVQLAERQREILESFLCPSGSAWGVRLGSDMHQFKIYLSSVTLMLK